MLLPENIHNKTIVKGEINVRTKFSNNQSKLQSVLLLRISSNTNKKYFRTVLKKLFEEPLLAIFRQFGTLQSHSPVVNPFILNHEIFVWYYLVWTLSLSLQMFTTPNRAKAELKSHVRYRKWCVTPRREPKLTCKISLQGRPSWLHIFTVQ